MLSQLYVRIVRISFGDVLTSLQASNWIFNFIVVMVTGPAFENISWKTYIGMRNSSSRNLRKLILHQFLRY